MIDLALAFLIVITMTGAVLAVGLRKVFHNLLGFGLATIGVAGITLILGSEFVALVQMLVFLGGISIAMVFAVMMSTPNEQNEEPRTFRRLLPAVGIGGGFAAVLAWMMLRAELAEPNNPDAVAWSTKRIGELLMTRFELPFEAISLLLLLAIIGAVVVARRTREQGNTGGARG